MLYFLLCWHEWQTQGLYKCQSVSKYYRLGKRNDDYSNSQRGSCRQLPSIGSCSKDKTVSQLVQGENFAYSTLVLDIQNVSQSLTVKKPIYFC